MVTSTPNLAVAVAGVQPCNARQSAQAPSSVLSGAGAARAMAGGSVLNSNLRTWQDRRHNRQLGGLGEAGRVQFLLLSVPRTAPSRALASAVDSCCGMATGTTPAQPGHLRVLFTPAASARHCAVAGTGRWSAYWLHWQLCLSRSKPCSMPLVFFLLPSLPFLTVTLALRAAEHLGSVAAAAWQVAHTRKLAM